MIGIHTHIHTYTHTYIHTYVRTYTYIHIHTYIRAHTQIHVHDHIHIPTCIHIYCTYMYVNSCINAYVHGYCTYINIQTIYRYIHTYNILSTPGVAKPLLVSTWSVPIGISDVHGWFAIDCNLTALRLLPACNTTAV